MKRQRRIRNNDEKSLRTIVEAGWKMTRMRTEDVARFVARKAITEDDDSITYRYESAYTIEGLAKQVVRREREEAR